MPYAYELDRSFEDFKPAVLEMINKGEISASEFAVVYPRKKINTKPIYFVCEFDVYPEVTGKSRLSQKRFEQLCALCNTSVNQIYGNETLLGVHRYNN